MNYLIDTNICIALIKGDKRVLKRLKKDERSRVFISVLSEAELWFGVYKSSNVQKNSEVLQRFLSPFERLPFKSEHANWFGEIKADLIQSGKLIGENDILLAAQALSLDLVFVTNNVKEFNRIKDLRIENWLR